VSYPKRSFSNKSGKVRIAVSLAGIVMNFVLAAVIFSIVYSITGITQEGKNIKITNISPGSPAQIVGLLVGDTIKKVTNTEITNNEQFVNLINENKGKKVQLEVEREVDNKAELKKFMVTPRENPPEGEGALGVTIASEPIVFYPPLWQRPIYGVYYGVRDTVDFTKAVILGFGQITKDVSSGRAPEGIVGPLGIVAVIIDFFRRGILEGAVFMGIISLNLAIFNLIPFPPLDGSRVMFVFIEKLFGKKILPRVESIAHSIGMVILLLMLIAISGREIPRLIRSGSISGFVDTLIK
jgi:regulator of sigma E protease